MLAVEKINVQFLGRVLFKDLSFTINAKDRVCFAGPNGAGKSTLMKIIVGLATPDSGKINKAKYIEVGYLPQEGIHLEGTSLFNEVETAFEDAVALQEKLDAASEKLGTLDPTSAEYADALEVFGEMQMHLENHDVSKMKPRIEKVLTGLGFEPSDFTRDVGEFSGGWQMRIALAKLLLREPAVLLLDEPTNHLDIDSQLWLENYITGYNGAVVIISHDRAFLDTIVKRTLAFEVGQVNEYHGNYSFYIKESEARREQLQREYDNQQREIEKTESFIRRFRAKSTKAAQVQSRIKALDKLVRLQPPQSVEKGMALRFPQPERAGQIAVELTGAKKAYGEHVIFQDFDFRLERGEKIAIVGANGAGKSTFSRLLSGADPLTAGERKTGHKVSISHFAQDHADSLNPAKTVLQTVEEGAAREVASNLRTLLGCFLFRGDDVFKLVSVLSGGERSRLSLAKMLLRPANLLILDEPTNHLDMQSQAVLQEAIMAYQGAIVIVSHNREFLDPIAEKVLEFYPDGRAPRTFLGNLSDFIDKKHQEESLAARTAPASTANTSATEPASGGKRKEQRKLEGQIRQQRANVLKPLNAKLEIVETSIATGETRKAEIETAMADPEFFKNKEAATATAAEYRTIASAIEKAYSDWSEVSDEIEQLEAGFAAKLGDP